MRFSSREIMYQDLGEEKFDEILENLQEEAELDERSPNGRQMYIVLTPKKAKPGKASAQG